MPTKVSSKVISAKTVRATKDIGSKLPVAGDDDCGCVKQQGCCQDKGCCKEGHCPAESSFDFGCAGDDFSLKIKDREDLIRDYIQLNKQSVIQYFKSKGVTIR